MSPASLGVAQAAVYAAEAAIEDQGIRWRRLAEAQAYVDGVLESEWWFSRWPAVVKCTLERRGSGARWSACAHLSASEGVVLIAPGCLTQPVVLHELAHLALGPGSGHGPAFQSTLLELVRHEMGVLAFAELQRALSG